MRADIVGRQIIGLIKGSSPAPRVVRVHPALKQELEGSYLVTPAGVPASEPMRLAGVEVVADPNLEAYDSFGFDFVVPLVRRDAAGST